MGLEVHAVRVEKQRLPVIDTNYQVNLGRGARIER